MSTTLFLIVCILCIIVVVIFTFVSASRHKLELCRKSPYYHCDTSWTCCTVNNCDTSGPNANNSYKTSDQFYGTNQGQTGASGQPYLNCTGDTSITPKSYYQACIAPVKIITAALNAQKGEPPDFTCLYTKSSPCTGDAANKFAGYKTYVPDLEEGQCCYKQFDPNSENSKNQVTGQYYPSISSSGALTNGAWNTQAGSQFGATMTGVVNNPQSVSNYVFKPKNNAFTVNNSCYNSFLGAPSTVNPSNKYGYLGCPGTST